jgi:hypothetical protein
METLMTRDDFTLTIEDASKRLNKSVRTIHRYKDSGRLSFLVGATQGNPLFFSRQQVTELAHELYPNLAPAADAADSAFWGRLERVERSVALIERNPLLERLLMLAGGPTAQAGRGEMADALQQLADLESRKEPVDPKVLGELLVRLGTALLSED